jgi:hypothetical protein
MPTVSIDWGVLERVPSNPRRDMSTFAITITWLLSKHHTDTAAFIPRRAFDQHAPIAALQFGGHR